MKREKSEKTHETKKKSIKKDDDSLNMANQKVLNVEFLVEPHKCELCEREISRSVMLLCAKCNIILCTQCLSKGLEKGDHKRNHEYYVLDALKHPIYSPDWTAKEELMLVKGIFRSIIGKMNRIRKVWG